MAMLEKAYMETAINQSQLCNPKLFGDQVAGTAFLLGV